MEEEKEAIPGYKSVEDFTKEGFKMLMGAIKSSNALPSDKDFDFYKVHESFEHLMNVHGDKLLGLMNSLLRKQGIPHNFRSRGLEDKVELLVEANDVVLERVANGIDEMNGIKTNVSGGPELQTVSTVLPINGSWNRSDKSKFSVGTSVEPSTTAYRGSKFYSVKLLTANIAKPQDFFTVKVDNSNDQLWVPRISEKPNSIKPLALFVEDTEDGFSYTHPYEFELDRFEPSAEHLKVMENPEPPKSLHCTPLVQVSLPEQLDELVEDLRKYSEFAIDVEHHSYRSFMGITCLIQISTVDTDYLVDTITLRDRLWVLNEVFTKPSIVKILHGADLDILWLQRDLSLYIVNMFDTHQAARQLHYPHGTLAYLLKRFCAIEIDKKFQLADWRVRPLSDELKSYARMDTHYLIYVYHLLKNELLTYANGSSNIIRVVFHNSTNICKRRFTKPIMTENSYLEFYKGCKRAFNNQQMYALHKLYEWRDGIARKEDESTGYVLPNHMLLQICEKLPREIQSLLACCNPVPPLLRTHVGHLHNIILTAKRQPLEKEILKQDNRGRGSTVQFNRLNIDSPLYCPHDLSRAPEFRNDLPTVLNRDNYNCQTGRLPIEKGEPTVSVFGNSQNQNPNPVHKPRRVKFMSPYQRYKSVKPFIRDEEEKAAIAAKEAAQNNNAALQTPPPDLENAHDNVHTEPTDEERIEGIHKHFIKEARTTPQIQPKSLAEMGGTKKRKRTEDERHQHDDQVPNNNELHTPVPNLRGTRFNRGKKRKQKNSPFGNQQLHPNANQQNNWNARQGKPNSNQQRNRSPNQQRNRSPNQQRNRSPNQQRDISPNQQRNRSPNQQQSQNFNQQTSASPNQQRGNQNRNRNRFRSRNKNQQQDNTQKGHCQAFDYTKVDYQQFQGGSSRVNTGQKVQSKFKGKNKPNRANRNPANKSGKLFRQAAPNKTNNTINKNV